MCMCMCMCMCMRTRTQVGVGWRGLGVRCVRRAWCGGGRLAASASPGARGATPPKTRLAQAAPFGGPGEGGRGGSRALYSILVSMYRLPNGRLHSTNGHISIWIR